MQDQQVKMSHGGLNTFFLSTGSDTGLHCALLNSEHAIPDLSPHPRTVHIFTSPVSPVIQVPVSAPKIFAFTDLNICESETRRGWQENLGALIYLWWAGVRLLIISGIIKTLFSACDRHQFLRQADEPGGVQQKRKHLTHMSAAELHHKMTLIHIYKKKTRVQTWRSLHHDHLSDTFQCSRSGKTKICSSTLSLG